MVLTVQVKFIRVNIGLFGTPRNRMHQMVDHIINQQFQASCTWTGFSRLGKKIAINALLNVRALFITCCSFDDQTINRIDYADIFKCLLKNAMKRKSFGGIRRIRCSQSTNSESTKVLKGNRK